MLYNHKILYSHDGLICERVNRTSRPLTKNLDSDGIHLHASHALQVQNVFASIVSVDLLHYHHGVSVTGLDDNALTVLDVGVHLRPSDPGIWTALECGLQPHGDTSVELQDLL